MRPVVEQQRLLAAGRPELAALRARGVTAISSADFAAVIEAPQMLTRPWTSVPSIVKKRLAGFSIGLV